MVTNNSLKPDDPVTCAKPDVSPNSQTVSSTGIQAQTKMQNNKYDVAECLWGPVH